MNREDYMLALRVAPSMLHPYIRRLLEDLTRLPRRRKATRRAVQAMKHRWRRSGSNLSLRTWARGDEEGKRWLRRKGAS